MTWEETIKYIRTQPEFKELVEKAYFEEDLPLNVERFKESEEFKETLSLIQHYVPNGKRILDVGSGNGISAIAFALNGYHVTASEPDSSETIGAGAIRKLSKYYKLNELEVYEEFAEKISLNKGLYDVVYVRQAMHHAYDLRSFIENLANLIKPNGFLFTVRDHVIFNEQDKAWFLETHPLQKFYGGENAFTFEEYRDAISDAGLSILKLFKHYDSVINYFPFTKLELEKLPSKKEKELEDYLITKLPVLGHLAIIKYLYKKRIGFHKNDVLNEKLVPGRMYSFIAQKK